MTRPAVLPPDPIRELDLHRSAWIEASAGTGKTYNIERLFLRLVAEKNLLPNEILMLSFTRKTADELRERIRGKLKSEMDPRTMGSDEPGTSWTPAQRKKIGEAYLRCDEAAVHTLHGFCQKALLTHALEMRLPFVAELRDEKDLVPEALEGLLRGPWSGDPGLLRELATVVDQPEKRDQRLCSLAQAYHPERGDRLHVRPDPNWLGDLTDRLLPAALELQAACSGLNRRDRNGEHEAVSSLLDLIPTLAPHTDLDKALALAEFFIDLNGNSKPVKKGFGDVLPATPQDAGWKRFAVLCDEWVEFRGKLRDRRKVFQAALNRAAGNETIASAVMAIRVRLARDKTRSGFMTYADMESKLTDAVRKNPGLAARLGAGFKACVVDEFQDTDPLQWELLQALCEGPRKIPLFLVGDPKQAIYGFRGGDLGTYLSARRHFHDLAKKGMARGFPLETNFRSTPRLIAALNSVFPHPQWFGPAPNVAADPHWNLPIASSAIVFTRALAPAGSETPADPPVILRDFSGRDGIPLSKGETGKALQKWVSSQMRLLSATLPYKDMAVLTRTNPEAMAMERHLRREGIPCRLRRAADGWKGPRADALRLLLELLEKAGEPAVQARILLLPFLRAAGSQPPGLPEKCPALIEEWARLAGLRRWPEFFQSVLFDSGYAYRLAAETGQDSDFHSWRALAKVLAAEGMRHGCSLRALRERIDTLGDESDDADRPLPSAGDSDAGGVNLMTLHGSKGLEFRAVFLSGMSQGVTRSTHLTLRDEKGFVHALDPADPDMRARGAAQSLAEEKRLFYVGLTRAREKLYIPLLPEKFKRSASGPLGGFVAAALRQAAEEHPDLFRFDTEEMSVSKISNSPSSTVGSSVGVATRVTPTEAPTVDGPTSIWPEIDPAETAREGLRNRRRRLASYSQLVRNIIPTHDEEGHHPDRDGIAIPDIAPSPVSTLPAGATTGTALHALLETVDFNRVRESGSPETFLEVPAIKESIELQISEYGLPNGCAPEIASLIWHSLRMNIPDPAAPETASFRLLDVNSRRSEVDFLMRATGSTGFLPEETSLRDGFLQGSIDLVFRYAGRYYLLDWKSNRLDGYGPDRVEASMREHRYDLQVQLYSVVLDRWLQSSLPGYEPEKHFGGAVWLFLRGAPEAFATGRFSGHAVRPTSRELRDVFPRRLRAAMGIT